MNRKLVATRDLVTTIDNSLNWFAFTVMPQKEYTAADIMRSWGIATYIPSETRWRASNKYTKARTLKQDQVFPAVPGYLFAGFPGDPPWYRLGNFPLVTGVLGRKDTPHHIVAETLRDFFAAYSNGSLRAPSAQRHMRTRGEFAKGDTVDVLDGVFRDARVPVIEIKGHMATVLMPLFGSEQEVDLPLETMAKSA